MVTTTLRRRELSTVFPLARPLLNDGSSEGIADPIGRGQCSMRIAPAAVRPATKPNEEAPAGVGTAYAALDPLGVDASSDFHVTMNASSVVRLVYIAAQTGQRFQSEGVVQDPVAWMMAPRELFAGRCAIEACQDRPDFILATLLHGLSLGLDADPGDLRSLLDKEPGRVDEPEEGEVFADPEGDEEEEENTGEGEGQKDADDWDDPIEIEAPAPPRLDHDRDRLIQVVKELPVSLEDGAGATEIVAGGTPAVAPLRLFTATVTNETRGDVSHLFHAGMAIDEESFAGALHERLGASAARNMHIMEGVDWSCDVVGSILESDLCCLLDELEDAGPKAGDALDVWVERRVPSDAVFA